MMHCTGVLCGGGFETPAEALFLKKKLLVIPMKGQYEQQCNAAALKTMGVPVLKSLKQKHINAIALWAKGKQQVIVNYPDSTARIISMLVKKYGNSGTVVKNTELGKGIYSAKKLKDKSLGKILTQMAE
jgi:Glycosyl transferase family 1